MTHCRPTNIIESENDKEIPQSHMTDQPTSLLVSMTGNTTISRYSQTHTTVSKYDKEIPQSYTTDQPKSL